MDILYEDNSIIVVCKPYGVPSQADETGDKDMLTMVKQYIAQKYNKPGNVYIGLVHRLDRPTGGVMVFARNSKSAARLADQIKNGEFNKTYLAVTNGVPASSNGTLINYLKKDEKQNKVSIAPRAEEGAKRAELSYNVLAKKDNLALLKISLKTGRSHQIRVQLANIKCPIVGDQKYGNQTQKVPLNLFATSIRLIHPVTKQSMVFRAYPPEDSEAWNKFNLETYLGLVASE